MFTLTDAAQKELDAYFDGKEKSAIRVYLASGGCSGPRLALALDEPSAEDTSFDQGGYTFCVNQALMAQAQAISIDCSPLGFSVDSQVPFGGGGCSGCSGGCSSDQ